MTELEKVEMATMGSPFLVPIEVEVNDYKITLIGEPRQIKTKYKDGSEEKGLQWVCDCVIKTLPNPNQLRPYKYKDQDKRLVDKSRTYSINDKSFNALVDQLGKDSTKWNNQVITLEVLSQPVNEVMKDIIYVKGAY